MLRVLQHTRTSILFSVGYDAAEGQLTIEQRERDGTAVNVWFYFASFSVFFDDTPFALYSFEVGAVRCIYNIGL